MSLHQKLSANYLEHFNQNETLTRPFSNLKDKKSYNSELSNSLRKSSKQSRVSLNRDQSVDFATFAEFKTSPNHPRKIKQHNFNNSVIVKKESLGSSQKMKRKKVTAPTNCKNIIDRVHMKIIKNSENTPTILLTGRSTDHFMSSAKRRSAGNHKAVNSCRFTI